ncbi:peptidoglycan DD-metalloendopeptidase family protein [Listeria booriae]|uniref:Peptidoglycan DD-metalloendopeptidase family protein n=1 Tax=Listeria booriae TaxID=1552123 RepID=A0A7X1D2L0_9LIST|nr:M23 family metallopeptidase [Listeria booriae]MBC1562906.1 peptidoglycan DD-metalloendopeptidase family protein [Listeria booriae]MBC1566328.1 peptidoglycan DD-metalloendopeptidase family protein [Listeria booriae]MBC2005386.1 peptidoglycan DD-metalloendopeptidase family protein [Listeria booriae]MBC2036983.1 peptidoglycan DD-metalloendopeptidase family protein [Listeria booriae]MBC2148682.1 peptidoglycan DD-metalloendopeptidase family protein [Listeria booriae]
MTYKKLIRNSIVATVAVGLFSGAPVNVLAADLNELQKQQQELQQQKANIDESIHEKEHEVSVLESKQVSAAAELEALVKSITETNAKLQKQQQEVAVTNAEVTKLKGEIKELQNNIQERFDLLKDRARAIQVNGNSQAYVNVILASDNFSDFIDRATMVTTLVSADKDIMAEQKKDENKLSSKQKETETKLASLKKLATEIALSKNNLESQKSQKDELILAIAAEKDLTQQQKNDLLSKQGALSADEQKVAGNIQAEKDRQAQAALELAAARKASAERAAKEAAAKAATAKASSKTITRTETPAEQPSETVSIPSISSGSSTGMFIKPAAGILTSGFSDRTNPVTGQHESHKGQDIAAGGSVPIYAAAGGTVVFSGFGAPGSGYGGYGYVVEIDHGNGYQTLYGHMRAGSLQVVAGQSVAQGQGIGIMGSTGQSTGQHLHFEIHKNGVPVDPTPYI